MVIVPWSVPVQHRMSSRLSANTYRVNSAIVTAVTKEKFNDLRHVGQA
jgi:hypothetical protein